ncbi:NACHT domain-containing protein [Streptomyces sp. NPDC048436]|uniref:NACHT domain-containing protein n=1 Tax=Streptomyces sp. NPDC048436 TaxID=3365550 RepID=UPI00371E55C2
MDPAVIGARLASSVVTPLIKKLFVREGPGAGLVEHPVRLSGLVSFRGEKRNLTDKDLAKLAAELVRQAVRASGERAVPADEEEAVAHALARTLHALGDLTLTDVEAVELGHNALALRLRRASGSPDRDLSRDAAHFYDHLLDTACLHILNFFTQRSAFIARTLVEQSRRQADLIAKIDELIARHPLPGAEDVAFEQRYLAYVAKKHGKLTIFGIDLANSPGRWPLDAAYMSLEATASGAHWRDSIQAAALSPAVHAALGEDRGRPRHATVLDEETEAEAASRAAGPEPLTAVPTPSPARQATHRAAESAHIRAAAAPSPIPADQALDTHDRVLLRGEAGSGKTTLIQWLAVSAARTAPDDDHMTYLYDRIPYVLPLRTLTRHGERLPAPKDFLSAVDSPLAGTQPRGWESRVLTAGRALVLVDGIDEIPEAERSRTRAWLSDLIDAYPGNRWLVTSRPSAVREDWLAEEDFTELTLSPMSRADATAFISRWHVAARTGAADEDAALVSYEDQLLDAVHAKPDLGRLATNPLMCGLICALHRDRRGFLPLGRKDLYTAALSMLLIRRDRERHMDVPELREEPQLQLLQRLAYWLIRNGRTTMDRSRAEAIIADALPSVPEVAALGDAKAVFEHFLHRSGLLREPGPGTVDFIHRTFQDFLGARAAVDEGDFGVLARHGADDQWEDVIRMAVAHARPRERVELFGELLAFGDAHADEQARVRVHLLAAACLEHAAELPPAVREQVRRRLAEVIPPRSPEAARELAAVGPMVLDLLPGPEGLSEQEAGHVAVTATSIPSDAAIPFLARFARHPALAVHSQLMWGWSRYDCRRYAEQVITQLNDGETYFTIRSTDQIMELERLGIRPKLLDIRETVSPAAASRLLTACVPTFLSLRVPPARLTPEALHALRELDQLRLVHINEPWSLSLIPVEAPLRTLGLLDSAPAADDVRSMDRWPQLEWVIFGDTDGPVAPSLWAALTRLPRLVRLDMTSSNLAHAPTGLTLPGLTELSLLHEGTDWASAASHVTRLCPHITHLSVYVPAGQEATVAPLVHLSALRHLTITPSQFSDLDALPSHIEVHAPADPAVTD